MCEVREGGGRGEGQGVTPRVTARGVTQSYVLWGTAVLDGVGEGDRGDAMITASVQVKYNWRGWRRR